MSIYAMHEQSDARDSIRLLATVAKACINDPKKAARHAATVRNMSDLIEAYQAHGFFGHDYRPLRDIAADSLTLLPSAEYGAGDLRSAFDQAFKVYEGQSKEQAITSLEGVLGAMTKDNRRVPRKKERDTAVRFFDSFIQKLETA